MDRVFGKLRRFAGAGLAFSLLSIAGPVSAGDEPTGEAPTRVRVEVKPDTKKKPAPKRELPNAKEAPGKKAEVGKKEVYLGVMVDPVPKAVAAQFPNDIEPGQGLLVTKVVRHSPAEAAGIAENDVLLKWANKKLHSADQLRAMLQDTKPDSKIVFSVLHDGRVIDVPVTLKERANDDFFVGDRGIGPQLKDLGIDFDLETGQIGELRLDPLIVEKNGNRGIVIEKSKSFSSSNGKILTDRSESYSRSNASQGRQESITVETTDGKNYSLQVSIQDKGVKSELKVTGPRDAIIEHIKDLPENVRQQIEKQMKGGGPKEGAHQIRVRLAPGPNSNHQLIVEQKRNQGDQVLVEQIDSEPAWTARIQMKDAVIRKAIDDAVKRNPVLKENKTEVRQSL